MCEYMACGKTVIASDMTGHADVITEENALPLTAYRPYHYQHHAEGVWFEPSLEEILEQLEFAYGHRNILRLRGLKAAEEMAQLTWGRSAAQFYDIGRMVCGQRESA